MSAPIAISAPRSRSCRSQRLRRRRCANRRSSNPRRKICVAIDPLDGSSNIDINMTVGTIFSILPPPDDLALAFHQRGPAQLAAGFVIYGPQTSLVLTLGRRRRIFTLDRVEQAASGSRATPCRFRPMRRIRDQRSNRRHWDTPVRAYRRRMPCRRRRARRPKFQHALDRFAGRGGLPHSRPAAACSSIPPTRGRAMATAACASSTRRTRWPSSSSKPAAPPPPDESAFSRSAQTSLHQRVPLIMGSINKVQRLERMHIGPDVALEQNAPLFARRGLFRV